MSGLSGLVVERIRGGRGRVDLQREEVAVVTHEMREKHEALAANPQDVSRDLVLFGRQLAREQELRERLEGVMVDRDQRLSVALDTVRKLRRSCRVGWWFAAGFMLLAILAVAIR